MPTKTITCLLVSTQKYNSTNAGKELVLKKNYRTDNTWKIMRDTLDSLKHEIEETSAILAPEEESYYPWAYTTKVDGRVTGGNFKSYPNAEVQLLSFEDCKSYWREGILSWMSEKKFVAITIKENKEEEYYIRIEGDFEI